MVNIKLEDSLELTPQKVIKEESVKPKKLRSLVKPEKLKARDKSKETNEKSEDLKNYTKFYVIAAFVLIAALIYSNITISSCGFWATYENNFNKIVHGDEKFCYRTLDVTKTIEQLKEQVTGQDDAIRLIKGSLGLASREGIMQIAMVGATGSGKTLSSEIIMRNWRWQKNVISTIFDINFQVNLTGQEAYDSDLREIEPKLSDCGFNLLVIDDVDVKAATIQRINELERSLHRMVKQKLFKLVIIVIFNGELQTESLNNFVIIEFEAFTEKTFAKCIEVHQKLRNVQLKPAEIEELKMINYTSSGCKTVAKKINLIANL